jgi:glycosyltransferase involved in cell wall biosynthesis
MSGARLRLKAAFLSERSDFFGGGQRSLRDLALAMRGPDIESMAILPGPGPLASALEKGGVPWAACDLPPLRRAMGISACVTVARLVSLVRSRSIDLLHSDSPRAALYGGLVARVAGCRHVWHLRSSGASSEAADRALILVSDAVVAVSSAAATRSAAARSSRKVFVVPTGLPPIAFLDRQEARRRLGLPTEPFVLGVIGRLEADKGCEDAVATLAALRTWLPKALLVFIGPGDRQGAEIARLRKRAAEAGIAGEVRFPGELDDAAALLRGFDLLLHPSRHEALPRVLIEAHFAGLPAVAYAVGGVSEVIEDGVTGLLVPPGEPRAFEAAATALALDAPRRQRMSEAAKRRAAERFGVERMARALRALYDWLVPDRSAGALHAREPLR